jgi:hypothetical protein
VNLKQEWMAKKLGWTIDNVEDFIVPPVEEALVSLGWICGGIIGYTVARLIFVILHLWFGRSPPNVILNASEGSQELSFPNVVIGNLDPRFRGDDITVYEKLITPFKVSIVALLPAVIGAILKIDDIWINIKFFQSFAINISQNF